MAITLSGVDKISLSQCVKLLKVFSFSHSFASTLQSKIFLLASKIVFIGVYVISETIGWCCLHDGFTS